MNRRSFSRVRALACLVLLFGLAGPGRAAEPVPYPKLYVCNNEGTDFNVVDLLTHKVVKTIDVGGQPHGITATAKGDRVYISCSGPNDVIAIDTATEEILWRTPVGTNPHMLAATPDGRYVFVTIFGNPPASILAQTDVIDTQQKQRIKTIQTGSGPHVAYAPSNDRVYVTAWFGKHVSVIDVGTLEIVKQIPCAGIVRPIAINKAEKRMFVALSGFHGFVEADLEKGHLVNIVEHPPYPPSAPVPEHNTPVHGLDFRPGEEELWVTSVIDDKIYVYDLPGTTLAGKVEVGDGPNWITFTPDGKRAYVSNALEDTISAIDCDSRREIAKIKVGHVPKRLLVVGDRTEKGQ